MDLLIARLIKREQIRKKRLCEQIKIGLDMAKENNKSFEESIERLEEIIQLLESDETPLEDIINYYEEGVKISKFCKSILTDTEKNIKNITKKMNK